MNSIRARLLVALLVLVGLISVSAGLFTYRRVLSESSDLFDYQLRQMALSLRSQVSLAPRIDVPPDQGDADFVIQIWDIFGKRVYLSRPGLPIINQTVLGYADLTLGKEKWRAFGLQTNDGVIEIAQPARVREQLASAAAYHVVLPLLLLLPVMFVAVGWVVRQSLRPLKHLTAEIQQRDVNSLTPLRAQGLPDELEPLAAQLNRLLMRLQTSFSAQRAFIADAAHELRSPLTALRLQIQLLERAPDVDAQTTARADLHAGIERSIHLVAQLLALARAEPHSATDAPTDVDLVAIAAEVVTELHAHAMARHIDIAVEAPAKVMLHADADALRVLLRNLVDNAVKYTPIAGRVLIRVERRNEQPVLHVIDSGPGIPPDEHARVFDRFYRGAGAAEAATGSGLGLSIVRAIADRYGARVQLGEGMSGGLRVSVEFQKTA